MLYSLESVVLGMIVFSPQKLSNSSSLVVELFFLRIGGLLRKLQVPDVHGRSKETFVDDAIVTVLEIGCNAEISSISASIVRSLMNLSITGFNSIEGIASRTGGGGRGGSCTKLLLTVVVEKWLLPILDRDALLGGALKIPVFDVSSSWNLLQLHKIRS